MCLIVCVYTVTLDNDIHSDAYACVVYILIWRCSIIISTNSENCNESVEMATEEQLQDVINLLKEQMTMVNNLRTEMFIYTFILFFMYRFPMFIVMDRAEFPNIPLTILRTRWQKSNEFIIVCIGRMEHRLAHGLP